MVTVKAFGAPEVRGDGGEPLGNLLSQPKRVALFYYLALSPSGALVRRDTLLALFWPELDQARGRSALRQALTFLRRELGRKVLVTRGGEEVGVDPLAVLVDVHAFQSALMAEDWEAALDVYAGDLLEGLHVAGAAPFLDWVDRERERLREAASGAAWRLAHERIAAGEPTEAERVAQRALALVPTDESKVRAFIEALATAGDRAAALRFYDKFTALLRGELEIDPAPETVAVEEGIRRGEIGAELPTPPSRSWQAATPAPVRTSVEGEEMQIPGTPPPAASTPGRRPRPRWPLAAALAAAAVGTAGLLLRASGLPGADHRLYAQGDVRDSFSEDDWLLVADPPGPIVEPELGLAFQALLIHALEASGYTSVVGGSGAYSLRQLADALQRMRMRPDTPLDADLGCSLAEREGAAGVLVTRVLPLGDEYVLELRLLAPATCAPAIRISTATSADRMREAVLAVSNELRSRLGESRRSIMATQALPPFTTSSTEALRLVREAWKSQVADPERTIQLLNDAIRADPQFAAAHMQLSMVHEYFGRYDEARLHMRRAYELREVLPRKERLVVEALYHRGFDNDPWAAIADLELALEDFPDMARLLDPALAVCAAWIGDWQRMLDVSLVDLHRSGPLMFEYGNAFAAALALGRRPLADSLAEAFLGWSRARGIQFDLLPYAVQLADWSRADSICAAPGARALSCGAYEVMRGRLDAGIERLAPLVAGGDRPLETSLPPMDLHAAAVTLAAAEQMRGRTSEAFARLTQAREAAPPEALPEIQRHFARFLLCTASTILGRPDGFDECRIEEDDPANWDRSGSALGVLRSGAWSRRLLAVRWLTRGDAVRALREDREAVESNFRNPGVVDHLIHGLAFEALSQPDSALGHYVEAAHLERDCFSCFPGGSYAVHLPWLLRHTGSMAEGRGDTDLALRSYRAFLELWSEADPLLQPQVEAVRARVAALERTPREPARPDM